MWFGAFSEGMEVIDDRPRSEGLSSATKTDENIIGARVLVRSDRHRSTVGMIGEQFGINLHNRPSHVDHRFGDEKNVHINGSENISTNQSLAI